MKFARQQPDRVRRHAGRRGATTVEFAMTAPVLFLFLFAAMEFSRYNMVSQTATNAAFEGARQCIVPGAAPPTARLPPSLSHRCPTVGRFGQRQPRDVHQQHLYGRGHRYSPALPEPLGHPRVLRDRDAHEELHAHPRLGRFHAFQPVRVGFSADHSRWAIEIPSESPFTILGGVGGWWLSLSEAPADAGKPGASLGLQGHTAALCFQKSQDQRKVI